MSYKIVFLFAFAFQCVYCYQQNVVLKWVSAQNLPKSGEYLTMAKNLTQFQDPNLCVWFKGTDERLIDQNDINANYIQGVNIDPNQCSLSLKSYNKETHNELDYYKPFLIDKDTYDSQIPADMKQKSGFEEQADLVYALTYFDRNEFKLHENETGKSNERKFMCHTKVFVKAHELGQEFTDAITERLQNQVHFEMRETLRISKRKVIISQFSHNSSSNFFSGLTKPRKGRDINKLIDYQTGDYKTVYMSDIQVLVSLCCTLRLLNEDNSVFYEDSICINGVGLPSSYVRYNQIVLLTVVFSLFSRKFF